MNVERHVRRQSAVDRLEYRGKTFDSSERAVARRMQVREIGNGAHPLELAGDGKDVVESPELLHAAHHLDPERDEAALGLKALAEFAELFDDGVDRRFARPAEEEAGMDHDRRRAARLGKARRVVQHADRHLVLASSALDMTHKARERRVDREANRGLASDLAKTTGEVPVHPETIAEVDLTPVKAPPNQ